MTEVKTLSPAEIKAEAQELQRMGYTFTGIARRLGIDREHIVNILYWEKIR